MKEVNTYVKDTAFVGQEDRFSVTDVLFKYRIGAKKAPGLRSNVTPEELDHLIGIKQPLQQKLD